MGVWAASAAMASSGKKTKTVRLKSPEGGRLALGHRLKTGHASPSGGRLKGSASASIISRGKVGGPLRQTRSAATLRGPGPRHPRKRASNVADLGPPSLLLAGKGHKSEAAKPESYFNVAPALFLSDLEFDIRQKSRFDFLLREKKKAERPPTKEEVTRKTLQRRASVLGYNSFTRPLNIPRFHRDQMETDTESASDDDVRAADRARRARASSWGEGSDDDAPVVESKSQFTEGTGRESTRDSLRSARLSVAGEAQGLQFPDGLRRGDYLGSQAKPRYFDVYRRILRKGRTVPLDLPLEPDVQKTLGYATDDASAVDRSSDEADDDVLSVASGDARGRDTGAADAEVFRAWDSPRHVFARCCSELAPLGCLPEPLFIRGGSAVKTDDECIDLSHRALGDGLACAFAKIIPNVPRLMSLSMRDNRLTDVGIAAVLHAVCTNTGGGCPRLTELNLSQNDIDTEAVESISEFLSFGDCALVKLTLDTADIDDAE